MIKQIEEDKIRNLIKNIENGKINLVLLENGKEEVFISEESKRRKMEKIIEQYDREIPILIHTLIGDVAVRAKKSEKNKIIHEEIEKLNQYKTIMFNSDYENDEIETVKTDFCDVISSITNHSYDYQGDLFDEDIDEFDNEVAKCKVKK